MIITVFAALSVASAQHEEGDQNLNIGLGIGGGYYYGGANLPALGVSYEKGIYDKWSVGGYLAYTSSTEDYRFFGDVVKYKYTYFTFGARASYHFDVFEVEELDTYTGAMLGYSVVNVSSESNFDTDFSAGTSFVTYSFFAGARYRFKDNLGAFAELGLGYAPLSLGLNLLF